MGLLKCEKGEIIVGNHKINNIALNKYYDNITYVSQEAPVFDGTLRENIVFDKDIKDEELLKVLEKVCLVDFYKKLENGFETELGEKGIRMSGGERQRLALARIFFENSKILILDEATSSMDNITEKIVMKNILTVLKEKTIIIIAHRLETIKDVNNIYVFNNGEIKEKGNYQELLEKNGYFAKLYNSTLK